LLALGFNSVQIGAVITASLFGSAIFTIATGLVAHRIAPARLLVYSSCVMIASGVAFGVTTSFVALLVIGFLGTLNPSAGDVSLFLPLEQASVSQSVSDSDRTAMFAIYSLNGALIGSIGALCAGIPLWIALRYNYSSLTGYRSTFMLYALAGVAVLFIYQRLSSHSNIHPANTPYALTESRRVVYKLSFLFSIDSLGSGFITQAIFALWVFNKFDLAVSTLGAVFFASGVLAAFSSLISVSIAKRIGLVRTMVFTHIPSSFLLIGVVFMPNVWLAMTLFILRGLLAQMDVPARQSYVMAVVKPEERAAAASITNVPRSLASALPPIAAGWMLDHSDFGWPLLVSAVLKIIYDVMLLAQFRHIRPPEEQ
jgi:predicted MFS family arabinose efflux permease